MRKIFALICTVAAIWSCTKEIANPGNSSETGITTLVCDIAQNKTAISEPSEGTRQVTWVEGDRLCLNGIASNPLEAEYDGKRSAQFTWNGVLSTPYNLLYPASYYKDESTITLPCSQNKMPGNDNIATDTFPMYGYSEDGSRLGLNYLCAILKISWTIPSSSATKISFVEVKGGNGEQMSGDFTINYTTGALTGISDSELSKTVRAFSIKEGSNNESFVCNIVVPARTYTNGFTVRLVDSDGNYMDKSSTNSHDMEAGKVHSMSSFAFVPTGQLDSKCISTAEELVAFAKDWNAGMYESTHGDVYLTSDIVFDETTSAAFVAAGGIGAKTNPITGDDCYYRGTFSGNGFSIFNLSSSVPIFPYTGSNASIRELTLDQSCSFTASEDGLTDFGALVGRQKGEILECHNYANVNVEGNSLASRCIGGLVGRQFEGDVTDSSMDGDIVLATGGTYATESIFVGGIAGDMQGDAGSFTDDCQFNGNIRLSDGTEFAGPSFASTAYFGGIAGQITKGNISNCSTSSESAITIHGTFKPRIGGIAGCVLKNGSVENCTNAATIEYKSNGARANTTPTYVGGIAGSLGDASNAGGSLNGCTNNGAISTKCNSTTYTVGGVAAFVSGTVANCTNNGAVTRYGQNVAAQGNRYSSIGGVVGNLCKGSVTHSENNGNLTYQDPGTATQTTIAMGGVVGRVNEGKTSAVTISDCSNSGTVYENGGDDVTITTWKAMGGIVGYVGQPATISNCDNSGQVYFNYNQKANGRCGYVGGIVGVCGIYGSSWSDVDATIQNCTNYGQVWSRNTNNTYDTISGCAACGGIAGMLYGNASKKISVTSCQNLTNPSNGLLISKRGYQGGIVGYASNAAISNCTSTKNTDTHSMNIPRYSGGIAGKLDGSSVSNCTVQGSKIYASSSANCDMGGVAGTMDATSSIASCDVIDVKLSYNTESANFKWGAIAGTTASGASITDCKLSGGWSVNAGSSYTPFVLDDVCSDDLATMTGNTLYSTEYDVTGTVSCGGSPLAGVAVSDGYQTVLTDSDGKYYIKKNADASCISVSIPSGYMPAVSNGMAAFYKKLSTISPVAGVYTVNFPMNAVSNPDAFTLLVYADIQIRTTSEYGDNFAFHSTDVAKDVFHDMRDVATAAGGNVIGVSLGDQANYCSTGEFNAYVGSEMLGSLNFANFSIPGNHDYDDDNCDTFKEAVQRYESYFGPSRYSFNYGKFHFVMVDNARRAKVESEKKGLHDAAWEWLQSDLKYVPKTTPIILCSHQPLFTENYYNSSENTYYKRDMTKKDRAQHSEYADLLASYKYVYAFNGDKHEMFNDAYSSNIEVHSLPRSTGVLWLNQFISGCGTPRGYLVMNVNGTNATYKYHPIKYQTGGVANSPSAMTYRDFSVTSGVAHMKSSYLSNPGAEMGDFYQMHAYAPGAYTGNGGAYTNDVLATVFMYDQRWSDVTFEYAGGSIKMNQIAIETGVHDPGFTWLYDWYHQNINDSFFISSFTNTCGAYNMFSCTPPSGVRAGTVRVTDHFGNDYEYRLSW